MTTTAQKLETIISQLFNEVQNGISYKTIKSSLLNKGVNEAMAQKITDIVMLRHKEF